MKITCFKIVNTGKINKTIQTRLCHKIFILNPQTLHLNDNLLLFQNIYFHVTIFIYFHNIYIYIYCTSLISCGVVSSLQVTVYFLALHLRFTKFGYNCCRSTDIRFYRFWESNFLPVEKNFQLNRIFEETLRASNWLAWIMHGIEIRVWPQYLMHSNSVENQKLFPFELQ